MIRYPLSNFKHVKDDIISIRSIDMSMGGNMDTADIYMMIICMASEDNSVYRLLGELQYAVFEGDSCVQEIEDILSRRSIQYILLQYKVCFGHLIRNGRLSPKNLEIDLANREVIEYGSR